MEIREDEFFVPQYLHRPYQVLFFETDEIIVFVVFFTLSLIFGGLILWAICLISPYILITLKRKRPRGFLKHYLYVVGIYAPKEIPHFFKNKFGE